MRSDGAQSTAPFDVNDVQGDVVPGFKTNHRRFLVVKIDEPHAARHVLSELADQVTKCSDVQKFRDQDQRAEAKAGPWLNVALSRDGPRTSRYRGVRNGGTEAEFRERHRTRHRLYRESTGRRREPYAVQHRGRRPPGPH